MSEQKPATMIPSTWTPVTPSVKALWTPGLFTISNLALDRHYVVGCTNVGRRVRDQHRWLIEGSHHCQELQQDWTAGPEVFGWFFVQRVHLADLVPQFKQYLLDDLGPDRCYNRKRAIPRRESEPRTTPLPSEFRYKPQPLPPTNPYDRICELLGEDAFDGPSLSASEMRDRAEYALSWAKRIMDRGDSA